MKILLSCFLILFSFATFSQTAKIDSVNKRIEKAQVFNPAQDAKKAEEGKENNPNQKSDSNRNEKTTVPKPVGNTNNKTGNSNSGAAGQKTSKKSVNNAQSTTTVVNENPSIKSTVQSAVVSPQSSNAKTKSVEKVKALTDNEALSKAEKNKVISSAYKKLFYFVLVLLFGIILLILKIKKQMDKTKTKYTEAKISLVENINSYKNTIISFNSLLKELGKETELVSFFNEAENFDENSKMQSLEDIFIKFNYDLMNLSKQAEQIEYEHNKTTSLIKKIEEETSVPTQQLIEKYKEIAQELEKARQELSDEMNKPVSSETLLIPNYILPNDVYINANILVSPGPRKDLDKDTELGEDAAGVLNTATGTFFWILDGTSDSPSIINGKEHVFSSRILAQLMNTNIRNALLEKTNEQINLKDILIKSVESSKTGIYERLKSTSKEIILKISESIQNNTNPYCSTTVLIGFLSKSGELKYFYLGDSEVLSFNIDGTHILANKKDSNDNPSRLFVSIIAEDNNKMRLRTNSYEEKLVQFTKYNIDLVVAFSDGIGASENALIANPTLALSKISLVNQLTYDDKTLLVLERVKHVG